MGSYKMTWSIIAALSAGWAKKVFPAMDEEEAVNAPVPIMDSDNLFRGTIIQETDERQNKVPGFLPVVSTLLHRGCGYFEKIYRISRIITGNRLYGL
jgi:hypothetical protein